MIYSFSSLVVLFRPDRSLSQFPSTGSHLLMSLVLSWLSLARVQVQRHAVLPRQSIISGDMRYLFLSSELTTTDYDSIFTGISCCCSSDFSLNTFMEYSTPPPWSWVTDCLLPSMGSNFTGTSTTPELLCQASPTLIGRLVSI